MQYVWLAAIVEQHLLDLERQAVKGKSIGKFAYSPSVSGAIYSRDFVVLTWAFTRPLLKSTSHGYNNNIHNLTCENGNNIHYPRPDGLSACGGLRATAIYALSLSTISSKPSHVRRTARLHCECSQLININVLSPMYEPPLMNVCLWAW